MTDQHIELKIHPKYKENHIRYVQVIRHIALDETAIERRERMERLRKSLMSPPTASLAATELEAIGADSILILKEGLTSPDPEVRYYSADALAYLGEGVGVHVLAEAAREEPAFRVFALAALTTLGTPEAREALKDLMEKSSVETVDGIEQKVSSAETRYGAFRALWTLDKRDELVVGENMNDEFKLHLIDSEGDSMVHLTRFRVPEVVIFGHNLKLQTPVSLTAGRHIMITAPVGSDTVTVSRFEANASDQQIVTTTNLADVIRAVGKLRAGYPDVAQMLVQAEKQSNLSGRLEIDALPQAGRIYYRMAAAPGAARPVRQKVTVGTPGGIPNMFPAIAPARSPGASDTDAAGADSDDEGETKSDDRGEASLVDVSEGEGETKPSDRRGGFLGLFRSKDDEGR